MVADGAVRGQARRLLATFADQAPVVPVQPIDPLTEREEEVLALVARGRTNAEIAMWSYDTRRVRADEWVQVAACARGVRQPSDECEPPRSMPTSAPWW
nr:LuxR C-terminal-related transcriptional regulator [Jiangella rhizosphaerae]